MSSGELDCIGSGERCDVDNELSELGLVEDELLLEGVRGLRRPLCVGDDGDECSEFWHDESLRPEEDEL